ncbi:MAG: hypothetical protein AB8H12_18160, partial [Lewinella sp.]
KGVEADELWAAIEQELPPEEVKPSSFKWPTIGLVLLGLLLAFGGTLNYVLTEEGEIAPVILTADSNNKNGGDTAGKATKKVLEIENEFKTALSSKTDDVAPIKNEHQLNFRDNKSVPSLSNSAIPTAVDDAPLVTDDALASDTPSEIDQVATKVVKTLVETAEVGHDELGTSSEEKRLKSATQPENEQEVVDDGGEIAGSLPVQSNDLEAANILRNDKAVAKLEAARVLAPLLFYEKEPTVENFKSIGPIKKSLRPRMELGIFVGTNMLRHRYPSVSTDDLADVLNATRGEALGQSASLEVGYRLKPGLKAYTGLELLKTHTTFSYSEQWDTVTMRNGQEIEAIATRRVQHNNRQTILSVPLMLEKSFAAGRWEAGLAAGLSFNCLVEQKGRSLNALQQVVTYSNGGGTNLPAPEFYLSYQLRPSINYRLNSRMSLTARADLRWQRYGNSGLYELSATSRLFGGSIGLIFGL